MCAPELKLEPTVTLEPLGPGETHTVFETVVALDLPTPLAWLGFSAEAITAPFEDGAGVEFEFESNFTWLPAERTRGWVSSHADVVDQVGGGHRLDFELDTALHLFNRLSGDHWLRDVEFETSLDYLASGTERWSLSFVFVVPVASF